MEDFWPVSHERERNRLPVLFRKKKPKKKNLLPRTFDERNEGNFWEINGDTSADEKTFFFHLSVFFWGPRPHPGITVAIKTWMNWSGDGEIDVTPPHPHHSAHLKAHVCSWRRNCFTRPSRLWDMTCRFHIKPSRSPQSFISVKMKKKKKKDTSAAGRKFWETTINSTVDVKSCNKFSELRVCSLVEPNIIQDAVLHSRPWIPGTNLVEKGDCCWATLLFYVCSFLSPLSVRFTEGKKEEKRKEKKTSSLYELPESPDDDDDVNDDPPFQKA